MAHDANPLTANTNVDLFELPDGAVAGFDKDDGLCFGDAQLPANLTADEVWLSRYGTERPHLYEEYLQKVVEQAPDDLDGRVTPDLHAGSAQDVLDGKTQVFVTSAKLRDLAREIGARPGTVEIGTVRLQQPHTNVTDLRTGESQESTPEIKTPAGEAAARASGEAASRRARAKVDGTLAEKPITVSGSGSDQTADATGVASQGVGPGETETAEAPEAPAAEAPPANDGQQTS